LQDAGGEWLVPADALPDHESMIVLWQDLQYACRFLRHNPGFSLAALATLALGIGANTAIFSFVNALLLRPLPFPEADRLVRIHSVRGSETGKLMPREWEELDRDTTLFEGVAAWYPSQYNLSVGGSPEVVRACMTTANLFRVLGVRLVHGSSWEEGTHRAMNPATVLNHELWRNRLGGDPSLVGKSLTLDAASYLVAGVAEPGFEFPVRSDIFRAAYLGGAQNTNVRSLFVVARLKRGVTIEQAQQRLEVFAAGQKRTYPETNRGVRFRLTPLRDAYVGEVRPYLLLTMGLVALVLLIACANVVNLLLSRGLARRREIAVRAALGAGQNRIIRQLLSESILLTLAGGATGLALAAWWMRVLRQMLRVDLPAWMRIDLDAQVLLFTLALSGVCGVVAGLAPALSAARGDLQEAVRAASRGSSGGVVEARLRRTLVGGELALAVTLLVAAGLLVRSFWRLQQVDAGFRRDGVLSFRTDPPWTRYNRVDQTALFYRQVLERLRALPGVEAAAANHSLPLALNQNYGKPAIVVEGQSVDEQRRNPFINVQIVSPSYLAVMDIPLLRGRDFTDDDRAHTTPVTILSRTLAERLFGVADPVGRRVRMEGLLGAFDKKQESWFTVIGVADGVRSETLLGGFGLDLYLSNQQQFAGDTFFVVATRGDPASLAAAAARAVRDVDPEQPIFDLQPLVDLVEDTVWQRRLAGRFSLWFGALALVLAAVGTYSVLSYAVSQRTRELGVRCALGSTPGQLVRLVIAEGAKLAGIGLTLGVAVAALAARAGSGLLYGVAPLDPLTFASVTALVAGVALLACYIPARRASRVDPVVALRHE
jgi:putative ABC transport system permease protein